MFKPNSKHALSHPPSPPAPQITSPKGTVMYEKEDISAGKFAFTAKEAGMHQVCFSNYGTAIVLGFCCCCLRVCCFDLTFWYLVDGALRTHVTDQQLRVLVFSMKSGVEAKDYSEVAKKEHLEPLEVSVCVRALLCVAGTVAVAFRVTHMDCCLMFIPY